MNTWKIIQRRSYDILSHKYSFLLILLAIVLLLLSAIQFGEIWLLWSIEKYEAVFNSYSDNLASKSLQNRLCQHVPVDVVYTWVNGSDPDLLKKLHDYEDQLLEETSRLCPYENCAPSHVVTARFLNEWKEKDYVPEKTLWNNVHIQNKHNEKPIFNRTIIYFLTPEEALEAVKQTMAVKKTNVSLYQAHWTTDKGAPSASAVENTIILTNLNLDEEEDIEYNVRITFHPLIGDSILNVWTFVEKNMAVVEFNNADTAKKVMSDTVLMMGRKLNVSVAYLIMELPLLGDPKDFSPSRFEDKEELRYSLRSLEKFAPWVRHVYLVTNGQIPYWLNLDNPRLTVVTHEEIFSDLSHLPTFSSPAIETHIHKIPGLSQKFLYLNDDVMFGKEVWPEDFITHSKGQKVYFSWSIPECSDACPWSWINDGSCDRSCNTSDCLFDGGDCNPRNEDLPYNGGMAMYDDINHNLDGLNQDGFDSQQNFGADDNSDLYKHLNFFDDLDRKMLRDGEDLVVPAADHENHVMSPEWSFNKENKKNIQNEDRTIHSNTHEITQDLYNRNKTGTNENLNPSKVSNLGSTIRHVTQNNKYANVLKTNGDTATYSNSYDLKLLKEKLNESLYEGINISDVNKQIATLPLHRKRVLQGLQEPDSSKSPYTKQTLHDKRANYTPQLAVHTNLDFDRKVRSKLMAEEQLLKSNNQKQNENNNRTLEFSKHQSYLKVHAKKLIEHGWKFFGKRQNTNKTQTVTENMTESSRKGSGKSKLSLDRTQYHLLSARKERDTFAESLLYVNRIFNREFGFEIRKVPAHMPHLIDKEIMNDLQKRFHKEWALTSSHRIRSSNDMQYSFSYFYFLMSENMTRSVSDIFDIFDTDDSGTLSDREIRTLLTRLYHVPLGYQRVLIFEEKLLNCSKILPKEIYKIDMSTPQFERYQDSRLPVVSKALVAHCDPVARLMLEKFGIVKKHKFEIVKEKHQEITFQMLNSNLSQLIHTLDEIRRDPKKFICLNDNLDPTRERDNAVVRAVLQDFYEALFPTPSSFELPPEFRNRFMHTAELAAWRAERSSARFFVYFCFAVVFTFTVLSFLHAECRSWRRRTLPNGRQHVRLEV